MKPIAEMLHLDFKKQDSIWLESSKTLRKTIGILGMLLPLLLYVFLLTVKDGPTQPLESISHYYYTRVSGIFVAIMSLLAIFLIIYKGKEKTDFFLSTLAGISAFLVAFFPTDNLPSDALYRVTVLDPDPFRESLHYIAAAIFLGCLAYMSLFLFTKTHPMLTMTSQKKNRNLVYYICGSLMVVAMVVIFFGGFLEWIPESDYRNMELTFWMETLAVESFGFAWLVKGEALFSDKSLVSITKKTE